MYTTLKYFHLILIAMSLCLFIIRFIWKLVGSKILERKWVKAVPHTVNMLLLLTGIALIYMTNFMPFSPGGEWLTEKLFCVLAYLCFEYVALHRSNSTLLSTFAFSCAIGWLFFAASLAVSKTPYY